LALTTVRAGAGVGWIDHGRRDSTDGGRSADTPRRRSGGRAATVLRLSGQIDHRLRRRGGSTTVYVLRASRPPSTSTG